MTAGQAKTILVEWAQPHLDSILNPGLLCPGCEGQMGPAYTNLYTVARQVLTGGTIDDRELIAAAITLENLSDD